MTLSPKRQQENEVNLQCSAKIVDIKEFASLKIVDIAEILGVRYETISRASNGKTGSPQLLSGLEILLENLRLKKRLDALEQAIRTMQTVKPSPHFAMNESGEPAEASIAKRQVAAVNSSNDEGARILAAAEKIVSAGVAQIAAGGKSRQKPVVPPEPPTRRQTGRRKAPAKLST
jgi:hypothetical protein